MNASLTCIGRQVGKSTLVRNIVVYEAIKSLGTCDRPMFNIYSDKELLLSIVNFKRRMNNEGMV